MEFLIIFNSSILPIFIIIAIAFVYNRLAKPDIVQVTNMTLMIFAPVFVFDSLVKTEVTFEMMGKPLLFMVMLTGVLLILAYAVAAIMRADENETVSIVLASSMINIANFGLPLIFFTYGESAKVYSVLNFVAFSVPLSTVAIFICSKQRNLTSILKDILKIPIFHAMIIALVVSHYSIPVPAVINKSFGLVGAATIPLMIFILGLQLSTIRIRTRFIRFMLPPVILRLGVSPVIACMILSFLGITGTEYGVAAVQTSAPAALLPLMYAIRFKRSPDLLAATIFMSTLLSGISLTILIRYIG